MSSVMFRLLSVAVLASALSACMGGDNNDSSRTGDGQSNPVEDSQGNGTDASAETGTDDDADVIMEEPEATEPETPEPETPEPEVPSPENPTPVPPEVETPDPDIPDAGNPEPEAPTPETPEPENPTPEMVIKRVTDIGLSHAGQAGAVDYVTFGHVFKPGEVRSGETLALQSASGQWVNTQVDIKARHPDGSARHAIISAKATLQSPNEVFSLFRVKDSATALTSTLTLADVPLAYLDVTVRLSLAEGDYQASLADAVQQGQLKQQWLQGELANEFILVSPIVNQQGQAHPHLHARFYLRLYGRQAEKAQLALLVENTYAYQAQPQDYQYDLEVMHQGKLLLQKNALTHYHKARWKQDFLLAGKDDIHVIFNADYLMDSGALPRYQSGLAVNDSLIQTHFNDYQQHQGLMAKGAMQSPMGGAGGRVDLGPLPGWTASYLLSQDKRAETAMLGNATQAGSWPVHFRMKGSDNIVRIDEKPYAGLFGTPGDMTDPTSGELQAFPACAQCNNPYEPDGAHQPSLAYLPYMLTGEYYYLEELQFWAGFNLLYTNPWYRRKEQGILRRRQVREEAWVLRSLGQVAYISPDTDANKEYFNQIVNNNLEYLYNLYVAKVETDRDSDKVISRLGYEPGPLIDTFGVRTGEYALVYHKGTGPGVWQDDFHTWSIGFLRDLGFAKAAEVLDKRARFSVERMVDPGYCWMLASVQNGLKLMQRNDSGLATLFGSFAEVFEKTTAIDLSQSPCATEAFAIKASAYAQLDDTYETLKPGQMIGYAHSTEGFPTNLRLALAAAVDSNYPKADRAWQQWQDQLVKPDYSEGPQMAVMPRKHTRDTPISLTLTGKDFHPGSEGLYISAP